MNYNKYLSNYKDSFIDFSIHILLYSQILYSTWYFRNNIIMNFINISLLGLMNMRNFIIFHDCGHNSYFTNNKLNNIFGQLFGIFCITPYCWNNSHKLHHMTSGNRDNDYDFDCNETIFFTKNQYNNFNIIKKTIYRIIRDPLIFFTIIPIINFLLLMKIRILFDKYYDYKSNIYDKYNDLLINNIGIYILSKILNYYEILIHYSLSIIIGSSFGFILFHNQHTFNPSYIKNKNEWNRKDSGLKGSSFIIIPKYLKYFTMGIEYHHIHHMNSKIPGYNLEKFHNDFDKNKLKNINKLSLKDCYNNLWLTLYDEEKKLYVSF